MASRLSDLPLTTFGDLAREGLEIEITCANCGHNNVIDGRAAKLRDRRLAGARFRCQQCGSVGLPSIGKARRWPGKAARRIEQLSKPRR